MNEQQLNEYLGKHVGRKYTELPDADRKKLETTWFNLSKINFYFDDDWVIRPKGEKKMNEFFGVRALRELRKGVEQ